MMLDRMGLDEQPMEKHGCIRSTSMAGLASKAWSASASVADRIVDSAAFRRLLL